MSRVIAAKCVCQWLDSTCHRETKASIFIDRRPATPAPGLTRPILTDVILLWKAMPVDIHYRKSAAEIWRLLMLDTHNKSTTSESTSPSDNREPPVWLRVDHNFFFWVHSPLTISGVARKFFLESKNKGSGNGSPPVGFKSWRLCSKKNDKRNSWSRRNQQLTSNIIFTVKNPKVCRHNVTRIRSHPVASKERLWVIIMFCTSSRNDLCGWLLHRSKGNAYWLSSPSYPSQNSSD